MSADSAPDDIQKESETTSPVKTLFRLWLTIRDPLKAMRRVTYDPDLLILLVMFMLFGIYSLPAAFIQVAKIGLPDEVMLISSPDELIGYGRAFTLFSDFKTDAAKLYWGEILVYHVMMILFGALVLIVGTRLLMGTFRYKEILSGVTYSSIVLLIVGIIQTGIIFAIPAVNVPTYAMGNLTYISWPQDQVALTAATTVNAAINLTAPTTTGTSELWDINLSTTVVQTGGVVEVDGMHVRGSSQGGSVVIAFDNGTSLTVAPGTSAAIRTSRASFQFQDSKLYVVALNGSLTELAQNAIVGFEVSIWTNQEESVTSNVTWPGTKSLQTWVLYKPQLTTILRNVSAPVGLMNDTVYWYWTITVEVKGDGTMMIQANTTQPYQAQTDSTIVSWAAESVLAQQMSVATYFSRGMAATMDEPTIKYSFLAIWAVSRAWQSVVLMCLLKASYEDISWLRAGILVLIQQFLSFQLGF